MDDFFSFSFSFSEEAWARMSQRAKAKELDKQLELLDEQLVKENAHFKEVETEHYAALEVIQSEDDNRRDDLSTEFEDAPKAICAVAWTDVGEHTSKVAEQCRRCSTRTVRTLRSSQSILSRRTKRSAPKLQHLWRMWKK
jgi:hypothetical protein